MPAGTFDTKHYKHELPKEAGGMTLDVWMSDKALPTGVVKMSGAGGIEMVLSATGSGAKPKMTGESKAPAAEGKAAPAAEGKAPAGDGKSAGEGKAAGGSKTAPGGDSSAKPSTAPTKK